MKNLIKKIFEKRAKKKVLRSELMKEQKEYDKIMRNFISIQECAQETVFKLAKENYESKLYELQDSLDLKKKAIESIKQKIKNV